MNVLITGAGGFAGSVLVKNFLDKGYNVFGMYRGKYDLNLNQYGNFSAIINDLKKIQKLPNDIDLMIHCAAEGPEKAESMQSMFDNNILSTNNIFELTIKTKIKKIIYFSSVAIYGSISTSLLNENTPIHKPELYGSSKLHGEKKLIDLHQFYPELETLTIRLPAILGKDSHSNFISDLKDKLNCGEKITINNPSSLYNGVIHIEDLSNFLLFIINKMKKGNSIITIAASNPQPFEKVIEILYKSFNYPVNFLKVKSEKKSFVISYDSVLDLGFNPMSVIETIQRFAIERK